MGTDDLARLLLLLITAMGGLWLVRGFFARRQGEDDELSRFAKARGGVTERWRRGFLTGAPGDRTGFCIDVFTEGTLRGGVVDVWRVRRERPAFEGLRFGLTRRGGEAQSRFDLEGAREPRTLQVEGQAPRAFGSVEVLQALEALFKRRRVRTLTVEGGSLEVRIERDAATLSELEQVLASVERVVEAYEKTRTEPLLSPPDPAQASVGAKSGAPVIVPLKTRR